MAQVLSLAGFSAGGEVWRPLLQSLMSVLSDYSQATPEDMVGVLHELVKAGLSIRNLSGNADPRYRGALICRWEGDSVAAIAFIKIPRRLCDGGCAIDICRSDKENRIDTFEVILVSSWN